MTKYLIVVSGWCVNSMLLKGEDLNQKLMLSNMS